MTLFPLYWPKIHSNVDSRIDIEDTLNMIFEESSSENGNDVESECDDQTVSCNCYKSSDISLHIESDQLPTPKLQSKDKLFGYSTQVPNQVGRTQAHNLYSVGNYLPRSVDSRIYSPLSALKCLISQNIVDLVVNSTQTCLDSIGRSFNFTEKDFWSWIGENLFIWIMKGKNASLEGLWDVETGVPYLNKSNSYFIY